MALLLLADNIQLLLILSVPLVCYSYLARSKLLKELLFSLTLLLLFKRKILLFQSHILKYFLSIPLPVSLRHVEFPRCLLKFFPLSQSPSKRRLINYVSHHNQLMMRHCSNDSLDPPNEEELAYLWDVLRIQSQHKKVVRLRIAMKLCQVALDVYEMGMQCLDGDEVEADADVGDIVGQLVLRWHDYLATRIAAYDVVAPPQEVPQVFQLVLAGKAQQRQVRYWFHFKII